jgi:hypothetical protein
VHIGVFSAEYYAEYGNLMTKIFSAPLRGLKRVSDGFLDLLEYIAGQESSPPAEQDSTFIFVETNGRGKRVVQRHQIELPAILSYGFSGNKEETVVKNLNERGLFVYCSAPLAHGSIIEVELVLPPKLAEYGKHRVRYHASVVRVEPHADGRFGVAAAIKRCEVLAEKEAAAPAH